jgi:hypothetical protein
MKTITLKITTLSLFAAALVAASVTGHAQDATTNAPAAASEKPAPAKHQHNKHDASVFNGKLSAIDTKAMTLTVGKRTFDITSETKITKDALPATLAEGVVGEPVGGAYKKSPDGKLTATSVRFGAKPEGEKKKKNKTHPDSSGGATNSVPN